MRFNARLLFCTVAPALWFVLALLSGNWGLARTQSAFDHYLATNQAVVTQLQELYAQGLQSGQAVRNIVLDPGDRQAVDNLRNARTAYDDAYADLVQRVRGTDIEAAVARMQALRQAQVQEQDQVVALAQHNRDAAAAALKAQETPAWRTLRAALLEQLKAAREAAAVSHAATRAAAQRMQLWSAALALLAVAVAGGLLVVMVRTLHRDLGCDPAEARRALRLVAEGDLTEVANAAHAQGLMGDLQSMRMALRELVQRVQGAAVQMHHVCAEIAQGNADLSDRTENQASALEQTAASMEELSATVRQNADNAQAANALAQNATQIASQGGGVVTQVVANMKDIRASSQRIADIIGVIDGIAFQTNILALNAAVEAARAGEQGRGFAVVAGEVRTLAQRSAQAAKEIKQLINDSVQQVHTGTSLVGSAGSTMGDIVASVQRVTDIIGEIRAATSEQTQGIGQVSEAMHQLDQMTQQNSALVEESSAAAESLREQAARLIEVVAQFRLSNQPASPAAHRPATTPAPRSPSPAPQVTPKASVAAKPAAALPTGTSKAPVKRPATAAQAATSPAPQLQATALKPPAAAPAPRSDDDWETF